MAGPTILRDTGAFAFDAAGPWALRAFNYDTQREELVSIEGRVLYFENRRRLDEFFGYLYGRGGDPRDIPLGRAVARSLTPVRYRPGPEDMPSAEYYIFHAGTSGPTSRFVARIGGKAAPGRAAPR